MLFPDFSSLGFYFNYAKDTLCIQSDQLGYVLEEFPGFMKNVRYLDVDFHHHFRHELKLQDMKDLKLVTVRELLRMRIVYPWKDIADTIEWLKVELQRGRDEGGRPHIRLASFVERQYIYWRSDESICAPAPFNEGRHWCEVPNDLWDRWVTVWILPRMSSRAWRKTGQSPTIFEVLLS
jgi:hypothetical protein